MITTWTPRLLSILRIMTGLLFVEHGVYKIFGLPHAPLQTAFNPLSMVGFSGILELIGGILIVVGLFTRIVSFILSGEMAVAYFGIHMGLLVHQLHNPFPLVNKGELAVLYCFVFLYFVAAGAGPWSLDALRDQHED